MKCKKCKKEKRVKSSMFCEKCEIKGDYFDDSDINVPEYLVYLKELLDEGLDILARINFHKNKQKYSGLKIDKE